MLEYIESVLTDHQINYKNISNHLELDHQIEISTLGNLIIINTQHSAIPIPYTNNNAETLIPSLIKSLITTSNTYDLYTELEEYLTKCYPDFNVGHSSNLYEGAYVYRHYYPNEDSSVVIEVEGDHKDIQLSGIYSIGHQAHKRIMNTNPTSHITIKNFIDELLGLAE